MIPTVLLFGLGGIALLIGLLLAQDMNLVLSTLAEGGFGLIGASLFHIVPMIVNAEAWRLLFVSGRPTLPRMVYAVWIRESVNGLLPVARIGGEVVSYRILMQRGLSAATVAASLITDITLSMVSQFLFTITGLVLLLLRLDDAAIVWRIGLGMLAVLPLLALFYLVQQVGIVTIGSKLVAALFGNHWGDLVGNAGRLDRMIRVTYRRPGRVIGSVFWQFVGWMLGTGEIWLALCAMGQDISLYDACLLESVAQAISSAAFLVPGAIGVQEGGFVLFGSLLGLNPQTALAMALARRIRDLVIFLPGLLCWQMGEMRHLMRRRVLKGRA